MKSEVGNVFDVLLDLKKRFGKKQVEEDSPLAGLRFQLLRALNGLSSGECMVVCYKLPSTKMTDDERQEFFEFLKNPEVWGDTQNENLTASIVPGTWFTHPIGATLLKYNWVKPKEQPHWVPNMCFFEITEDGKKALNRARAWWSEQSFFEKVLSCLKE